MERSRMIPENFNEEIERAAQATIQRRKTHARMAEIDEQMKTLTKEREELYDVYYYGVSHEGLLLGLIDTLVDNKIKELQVSK